MSGDEGLVLIFHLVGHRIAQGIDADGLMVRVGGALQQLHRLQHVGMAADDHIDAKVTHLLGNAVLGHVFGGLVFLAPVDVQNGRFRAFCLHGGKMIFHLGVEPGQIVLHKEIDDAHILHIVLEVQGGPSVGSHIVGVGIAEHTHLDAVDIDDLVLLFLIRQHGAQGGKACLPGRTQRPLDAGGTGVGGVVIGSQQHIIARLLQVGGKGIGAVELRIAPVGVLRAAEGGLQVGNGVVGFRHIFFQEAEDVGKVIAAVLLLCGVQDAQMHQQVSLGADGGGGYQRHRRLRGLCLLRLLRLLIRKGGAYAGRIVGRRRDLRRLAYQIEAQLQHIGRTEDTHNGKRYQDDPEGILVFSSSAGHFDFLLWGISFIYAPILAVFPANVNGRDIKIFLSCQTALAPGERAFPLLQKGDH